MSLHGKRTTASSLLLHFGALCMWPVSSHIHKTRLVRREMFFEAFQTAANDVEKMKWDGKNRQETISGYF